MGLSNVKVDVMGSSLLAAELSQEKYVRFGAKQAALRLKKDIS